MQREGKYLKGALVGAIRALGVAAALPVQAAEKVNVAFFLEWATPNEIAKVDKAYIRLWA